MNILLVDDERPARDRLRALITEHDARHRIREAGDGTGALHQAIEELPEVVLLDIRMPGMDGLEAAVHLGKLEPPPAIIFTTAYEAHALAAFEAHAIDYLLKPINRARLHQALERAHMLEKGKLENLRKHPQMNAPRSHISATHAGCIRLAPVKEIRLFKAEQKYVLACWPEGQLLLEEPLHTLEDEFAAFFLRVHRNALAAIQHVSALEPDEQGGGRLHLHGIAEPLQVSRRMLPAVRRRLHFSLPTQKTPKGLNQED